MELYAALWELGIEYRQVEHEAVFTVAEAQEIKERICGVGTKNLFLKDKKGGYWLAVLEENARADLKGIAGQVGCARLSFADEEALINVLGLTPGSVTPFGVLNDKDGRVTVLVDESLKAQHVLQHPNRNTATLTLKMEDLLRFITHTGHEYRFIQV